MHESLFRPALAASCLLLVFAAGCQKKEPEAREIVRPVKWFTFGAEQERATFAYPGRVFANQTVEVAFEVNGKLEVLPVVRGQQVKAGELLARLDQRDFINDRDGDQALLDEAKATYQRFKKAAESNAVAKQQVDEAMASLRLAESELKISEKALEDSAITADFDGIVANRYVENFQNVVAKSPILSLQDISQLEIRINIPERDMALGGIEPGDLRARFSAMPEREFELSIKEFATEADPVAQTFLVTLLMPNLPGQELLPGMTATVLWRPSGELGDRASTVPATAVGGEPEGEAFVWIVDTEAGTVSRRTVELGQILQGNVIEIRSGLQAGEVVAAAGVYQLEEGMKIRRFDR